MSQKDTLFRHLAMLQMIPRSPQYRATSTIRQLLLEQGFDVNLRTIQRDLEKLSLRFPLQCDRAARPFRWSYIAGYRSDLPAMDTATALTLVLAEEFVKGLLPQVAWEQISHKFHAARQFLDSLEDNGFARWSEVVRAIPNGKTLLPAPVASQVWQTVTDALLSHYAIDVDYLSRSKSGTHRLTLHPLGLVSHHSVTYLLATANDYDDIRLYALHRIEKADPSLSEYRGSKGFRVVDYIATGAFGFPYDDQPVRLVADISADLAWRLRETPLSTEQSISDPGESGYYRLEAMVPNDQQTQWWIMAHGANIHILQPAEWREQILQHARQLLDWESGEERD